VSQTPQTTAAGKVDVDLIGITLAIVAVRNVVVDTPLMVSVLAWHAIVVLVRPERTHAILFATLINQPLAILCLVVIQTLFVTNARTALVVSVDCIAQQSPKVRGLVSVREVGVDLAVRTVTLMAFVALIAKDVRSLTQHTPDALVVTLKALRM
jgi:hypothetical protein